MLSYPVHGWTDFQLPGTSVYSLSYLTDIPGGQTHSAGTEY